MHGLALVVAALSSMAQLPEPRPEKIGVSVAAAYFASTGGHGVAVGAGVRLRVARHFAVSFDTGYGLMSAGPEIQDRWWLMPAVAFVIPAGRFTLDLGAGAGFGETAAFASCERLSKDKPLWAFQLIPAVRAHARISMPLTHTVDLFARADAATLLLEGNSIGFREGDPSREVMDTMWLNVWVGFNFGLL